MKICIRSPRNIDMELVDLVQLYKGQFFLDYRTFGFGSGWEFLCINGWRLASLSYLSMQLIINLSKITTSPNLNFPHPLFAAPTGLCTRLNWDASQDRQMYE